MLGLGYMIQKVSSIFNQELSIEDMLYLSALSEITQLVVNKVMNLSALRGS